jgi:hypothetical protein
LKGGVVLQRLVKAGARAKLNGHGVILVCGVFVLTAR